MLYMKLKKLLNRLEDNSSLDSLKNKETITLSEDTFYLVYPLRLNSIYISKGYLI